MLLTSLGSTFWDRNPFYAWGKWRKKNVNVSWSQSCQAASPGIELKTFQQTKLYFKLLFLLCNKESETKLTPLLSDIKGRIGIGIGLICQHATCGPPTHYPGQLLILASYLRALLVLVSGSTSYLWKNWPVLLAPGSDPSSIPNVVDIWWVNQRTQCPSSAQQLQTVRSKPEEKNSIAHCLSLS